MKLLDKLETTLLFLDPVTQITKHGLNSLLKHPVPVWYLIAFAYSNNNCLKELLFYLEYLHMKSESAVNQDLQWLTDYAATLYSTYLHPSGCLFLEWVSNNLINDVYSSMLNMAEADNIQSKLWFALDEIERSCFTQLKLACWPTFEDSDIFYNMISCFNVETSITSYKSRRRAMIQLLKCFPELKLPQNLDLYDIPPEEAAKEPTLQEIIDEKIISYLRFTSFKINDDLDPYEVSKNINEEYVKNLSSEILAFDNLARKIKVSITENATRIYQTISSTPELQRIDLDDVEFADFIFSLDLTPFYEIEIDCCQVLIILDILIRRFKVSQDSDVAQTTIEFSNSVIQYNSFLQSFNEMNMDAKQYHILFKNYINLVMDCSKIFASSKLFLIEANNSAITYQYIDLVQQKLWVSLLPSKLTETDIAEKYFEFLRYLNNMLFDVDDISYVNRIGMTLFSFGYKLYFNALVLSVDNLSEKDIVTKVWLRPLEKFAQQNIELGRLLESSLQDNQFGRNSREKFQMGLTELLRMGQKMLPILNSTIPKSRKPFASKILIDGVDNLLSLVNASSQVIMATPSNNTYASNQINMYKNSIFQTLQVLGSHLDSIMDTTTFYLDLSSVLFQNTKRESQERINISPEHLLQELEAINSLKSVSVEHLEKAVNPKNEKTKELSAKITAFSLNDVTAVVVKVVQDILQKNEWNSDLQVSVLPFTELIKVVQECDFLDQTDELIRLKTMNFDPLIQTVKSCTINVIPKTELKNSCINLLTTIKQVSASIIKIQKDAKEKVSVIDKKPVSPFLEEPQKYYRIFKLPQSKKFCELEKEDDKLKTDEELVNMIKDFPALIRKEHLQLGNKIGQNDFNTLSHNFIRDLKTFISLFISLEKRFHNRLEKAKNHLFNEMLVYQKEYRTFILGYSHKFLRYIEHKKDELFQVPTIDVIMNMFASKNIQFWLQKERTTDYETWYGSCTASLLYDDNSDILLDNNVDDHSRIKGGTLSGLVRRLVYYKFADPDYYNIFITLYCTFTNDEMMLEEVANRYANCLPKDTSFSIKQLEYFYVRKVLQIRQRITKFYKDWLETYPKASSKTLAKLEAIIATVVKPFDTDSAKLLQQEIEKVRIVTMEESFKNLTPFGSPMGDFPKDILQIPAIDFAHSLTMLDYEVFCKVKINECLSQRWNKESTKHLSPNITQLIKNSAQMTFFVAAQVLSKATAADRGHMIAYFVEVALDCLNIRNYNAVFAIMSGLTCTPIFRLKNSWEIFRNDKKFKKAAVGYENLEKIVDTSGNTQKYRSVMKTVQPPCLPFLGLYLTDLTFIDQGNLDTITTPEGKTFINFEKQRKICYLFNELAKFQSEATGYAYKVPSIADIINSCSNESSDEDALYDLSLKVEPRGS